MVLLLWLLLLGCIVLALVIVLPLGEGRLGAGETGAEGEVEVG